MATATFDLQIHGASSLKEKRSVLKSLKDRLRNDFNISVAETGHHDLWQRAELTIALVTTDRRHADAELARIDRFVAEAPGCRVVDTITTIL